MVDSNSGEEVVNGSQLLIAVPLFLTCGILIPEQIWQVVGLFYVLDEEILVRPSRRYSEGFICPNGQTCKTVSTTRASPNSL